MEKLLDLIYSNTLENWTDRCNEAFNELYGAAHGRYPDKAQKVVTLRAPIEAIGMILIFEITICDFNSMQPDGD
jgi:hypothetical protein